MLGVSLLMVVAGETFGDFGWESGASAVEEGDAVALASTSANAALFVSFRVTTRERFVGLAFSVVDARESEGRFGAG